VNHIGLWTQQSIAVLQHFDPMFTPGCCRLTRRWMLWFFLKAHKFVTLHCQ